MFYSLRSVLGPKRVIGGLKWGFEFNPQSVVLASRWLIWGLECGCLILTPESAVLASKWLIWGLECGCLILTPESAVLALKWLIWGLECRCLILTPESAVLALKWLIWGLGCVCLILTPESAVLASKWLIWGLECGCLILTPGSAVLASKWLIWGLECGCLILTPESAVLPLLGPTRGKNGSRACRCYKGLWFDSWEIVGPVRFGSFCKRFVHGSFLYGSKTSVRIDLQAYCFESFISQKHLWSPQGWRLKAFFNPKHFSTLQRAREKTADRKRAGGWVTWACRFKVVRVHYRQLEVDFCI